MLLKGEENALVFSVVVGLDLGVKPTIEVVGFKEQSTST